MNLHLHTFIYLQAKRSFVGHKVIRAQVKTSAQADLLLQALEENDFDLWSEIGIARDLDIHVAPAQETSLTNLLDSIGVQHRVMISDLQTLVTNTRMGTDVISQGLWSHSMDRGHSMDWTNYHPIEDMHSYMSFLQDKYDFVCLESIGKSYEGSEMVIAKVCKGGCGNKPAMWIDGGIHAREWISPATVMWLLKELVENHEAHPDLLESLDW